MHIFENHSMTHLRKLKENRTDSFVREKYTRLLKFLRIFFWEVDNFWYLSQIIEVNFRK